MWSSVYLRIDPPYYTIRNLTEAKTLRKKSICMVGIQVWFHLSIQGLPTLQHSKKTVVPGPICIGCLSMYIVYHRIVYLIVNVFIICIPYYFIYCCYWLGAIVCRLKTTFRVESPLWMVKVRLYPFQGYMLHPCSPLPCILSSLFPLSKIRLFPRYSHSCK